MDLLADVAKLAREQELHLRVDILHILLDDEPAFLAEPVDVLQFSEQLRQLVVCQQADALKHRDVCHGAEHVIFGKVKVHLTVAAYGEPFYLFVDLKVLFPEFIRHVFMLY